MRITSKRLGPFIILGRVGGKTYYAEIYNSEMVVTYIKNNATIFQTIEEADKAIMRLRFEFPNVEWNIKDIPFRIFAVA
jgi:hypothetical protein